ncbi:MAG TPA: O-antigen ligase family protein [Patescibacteria group bacterium]
MVSFLQRIIRVSFYALFLLVPLVFTGDTSELFEFNKIWLTFGLAAIIAAAWISKMLVERQVKITRTPLDIPLMLFVLSQCISTILSIDPHVSWWGYYSRFNGGLLSILTYVFLYYAFVSNFEKKQVFTALKVSLVSALIVSLWGLPSHFGYDPTCFIFRGNFDVSCWTAAFQPKARIFSTMGQPDWLAAYLSILIPIALGFGIDAVKRQKWVNSLYYFVLGALFYIDLLYTRSKSSFIALSIGIVIFLLVYILFTKEKQVKIKITAGIIIALAVITFFAQTPFPQLDKFTLPNIVQMLNKPKPVATNSGAHANPQTPAPRANAVTGELGGTDSGKIRLYVWQGAIQAWLHNPLFGTGVETFAFAYYLYRPSAHNLTSEWDYLYNKAHNEYLNYLATTGAFGLITYLAVIFFFLFLNGKYFFNAFKKQDQLSFEQLLILGSVTAYLTILISNFFGFSVVIINEYMFIIPGIFFLLTQTGLKQFVFPVQLPNHNHDESMHAGQWIGMSIIWIIALYWILVLFNFWTADKAYALGLNYDRAGLFQDAYQPLHDAVNARPDEPVFLDEFAVNDATLAQALFSNKDTATAQKLEKEAVATSDYLVTNYSHNVTFWKSRVRVLYALAQMNLQYLPKALDAIKEAQKLAPTDAKVNYNLGLLYAQNNQTDNAVAALKKTLELKPDYRDAYYALALLLHQQAVNTTGVVVNQAKEDEAVKDMLYIYQTLAPGDAQAKEALKTWGQLPQ